jgi:hypothetical protein
MLGKFFKRIVLSPQLWLAAAALSVAGSLVVDYIDAQRTADRALALRQGPPPVALLQEYEPSVHVGPAREVVIRAETDLADPVIVSLGPEGATQTAVIFPLFPVSDVGLSSIRASIEGAGTLGAIRPVPRPTGATIAPQALGVVLYWADSPDVDINDLIARRFGAGRNGSVIEVNGERVAPGDMALVVKGAMAAQDMEIADGFLAVSPFRNGRIAALSPPPSSGLQRGLFWGGVTLALGGLIVSMRSVDQGPRLAPNPKRPGEQDTRVSPGSTAKARSRFQSIPTQDEIYATAQARKAREAEARRKPGLMDTARSGIQKIKIRQ